MGVLLFQRGWALHDRETALFGELPRPFPRTSDNRTIELFHEIDNRPGYYAGVEVKWRGEHVLRLLRYDNRGEPARNNGEDYAWLSRFDALGARFELSANLTLIAQGMWGDTAFGASPDRRGMWIADYWSYFGLLSHERGRHRFTVRYDRMYVESTRGAELFESNQDASAWTAAYIFNRDRHWQVGLEALLIDGSLEQRSRIGLPAAARERQLQLALRYSL